MKVSIMSLLIIGACGAIAYNVLALQTPMQRLPGSTAVRVQVNDVDVSNVADRQGSSSIGQLLEIQSQPRLARRNPLTASIQDQLNYLGFYLGVVDGQNGPRTIEAIKQYQQQNALPATGQVSHQLLEKLKFSRKISDAGNITGSIPLSPAPDQKVLHVQERLAAFGYAPGEPDGVFGVSTSKAISRFESDRSLPITGKITANLLLELGF